MKEFGLFWVVECLNLEIEKGMVFGMLGFNGSGKIIILGMVLGIIYLSVGFFEWFGG